jgi:hypothetical protein
VRNFLCNVEVRFTGWRARCRAANWNWAGGIGSARAVTGNTARPASLEAGSGGSPWGEICCELLMLLGER